MAGYYDIIGAYRQAIVGRMNPYLVPTPRQPAPVGYAVGHAYPHHQLAMGNAMAAPPAMCPPNPCLPPPAGLISHGVDPRVLEAVPVCANKARQYPLNFRQDAVAAGATVDIQANPQALFKGQRLVVPSFIAVFFDIEDLTVANKSQFVAPGALQASVFSENAVNVLQEFDSAQPGVLITLRVTNTDVDPQDFRATVIGAVIE